MVLPAIHLRWLRMMMAMMLPVMMCGWEQMGLQESCINRDTVRPTAEVPRTRADLFAAHQLSLWQQNRVIRVRVMFPSTVLELEERLEIHRSSIRKYIIRLSAHVHKIMFACLLEV
jgi:hypothetical protein